MRMNDKLILWGAWMTMIVTAGLFIHRVSRTPKIDPWVAQIERELHPKTSTQQAPPPLPKGEPLRPVAEPQKASDWAAFIVTRPIPKPYDHPTMEVRVLPVPVIAPAPAVDRDAVTLTWTLANPVVPLEKWMILKEPTTPTEFVVLRSKGGAEPKELAVLKGDARRYLDLTAEPRATYHYWMIAKGPETLRTAFPAKMIAASRKSEPTSEVRAPSATRVLLVGGALQRAILTEETYDKTTKKWIGRTVGALPGQAIGTSGWTLKGLKFDNFTLVADVTDDDGVDHVLTTKN